MANGQNGGMGVKMTNAIKGDVMHFEAGSPGLTCTLIGSERTVMYQERDLGVVLERSVKMSVHCAAVAGGQESELYARDH